MNLENNVIEIPLTKSKIALALIGAILFVVMGLWFVISQINIENSFEASILVILGGLSILVFGIFSIYLFYKLFDKKAGLIIDNVKLLDNSSALAVDIILWSDINNLSIIEIHRQKLVILHLRNPQDYIERQSNFFKRLAMKFNYKMYGSPICISTNGLNTSFEELLAILVKYYNQNQV